MAYVLMFVQRFRAKDEGAFMALESWTDVYEVLDFEGPRHAGGTRAS